MSRRKSNRIPLGLSLLAISLAAFAEPPPAAPARGDDRPRVGLVLSGGGAKGAAHVGVIEILEELNVPVDFIVGTSMGAIVGGLYASGVSPEEMGQRFTEIDWADAFSDQPDRKRRPYRRKEDDLLPLFDLEFGLGKGGLKLPAGLVAGQKLNFLLRTMLLHASRTGSFDDLPIPFRAVSADLESAEVVVLDHGDLATAIRSSMAYPLMFTPVEIEGRKLVDGGALRNIPIDVALAMGADRLIVVDVSAKLQPMGKEPTAMNVARRSVSMMSAQNREVQLELLRPQDLLIVPDLEGLSFESFDEADVAIERGVTAAREHEQELRSFSVPEARFGEFIEHQRAGREMPPITVDFVEVTGVQILSPKLVRHRIKTRPGDTLDLGVVAADLERIYKTGEFERVEFRLEERGDQTGLVFEATEKGYGPWFIRPGLSLFTDLGGRGGFFATALIRRPHINRLGAEWKTVLNIGSANLLFSEFYQPVEYASRFFVAPSIDLIKDVDRSVLIDGVEVAIKSEYRLLNFDIGSQFGNVGEIRLGYRTGRYEVTPATTVGAEQKADLGLLRLRTVFDRLDNTSFPTSGNLSQLELVFSRDSLGADDDFDRLFVSFGQVGSFKRLSLFGTLRYGDNLGSSLPFYSEFTLGGLFNMSGLRPAALRGGTLGFARLLGYYRLGKSESLLGGSFYLGLSLEVGNVWTAAQSPSFSDLRPAGAVFAGMSSILGPLYVGWGVADGGQDSFYLLLGRVFDTARRRF